MRSAHGLTALFRSITALTLTGGALTACSSSSVSRDGLSTNVCEGSVYNPILGVTPKVAVDYLEFRGTQTQYLKDMNKTQGVPCDKAVDKAKCAKAFGELQPAGGLRCRDAGCQLIVYTRGDQVGAVTNKDELLAFISVQNEHDAALVAWSEGHDIPCNDGANAGAVTAFRSTSFTGINAGVSPSCAIAAT